MKCTAKLIGVAVSEKEYSPYQGKVVEADLPATTNVGDKYWFHDERFEVVFIDPSPNDRKVRQRRFVATLICQIVFSVLGSLLAIHFWSLTA